MERITMVHNDGCRESCYVKHLDCIEVNGKVVFSKVVKKKKR